MGFHPAHTVFRRANPINCSSLSDKVEGFFKGSNFFCFFAHKMI